MKKSSKNIAVVAALAMGLAGFSATGAMADYYLNLTGSSDLSGADQSGFNIGTEFTVSSDIYVTALGAWGGGDDANTAPTLSVDTTAYLYDATTQTLLASVDLTAGTPATGASTVADLGWAFGTLTTPVELNSTDSYIVSSDSKPGDGYTHLNNDYTAGADTTVVQGVFSGDGDYPSNGGGSSNVYAGGNFEYEFSVPEPATWAMMLGGLLALAGFARLRRKA